MHAPDFDLMVAAYMPNTARQLGLSLCKHLFASVPTCQYASMPVCMPACQYVSVPLPMYPLFSLHSQKSPRADRPEEEEATLQPRHTPPGHLLIIPDFR
jgi:hypothetical protein